MDFQEIDAASSRGVDDTKQLLETVMYMPSASRYKVYLLDEVHMLSTQSFNMLLKTLEEPPEHVIFILATTLPEKIPATVLSRCLQFNLKNLTNRQLTDRLKFILNEEEISFEDSAIEQIAMSGRGSLRDALTITDQAIAYCDGKLTDQEVSDMLGTLPADNIFNLISCVGKGDAVSLLEALKKIGEQSIDYFRLMDLILENIQLLTFAKVSEETLDDIEIKKEDFKSLMNLFSAEDLQLIYQIGLIAKRDMELAPNLSSGFDMAMLRMLSFIPKELEDKKKVHKEELNREDSPKVEKLQSIEKIEIEEKPVTEEKPVAEEKPITEELEPTSINVTESLSISTSNWKSIFDALILDPGTKQLASHCYFIKVDETVIYLSMPEEKLNIFSGKHRKQFQDSISEYFGTPCNLFFESGEGSENSPNKIKEQEKRKELEDAQKAIEDDPNVKSLVEAFGAEVIESSIEPRK
jgi:DNA polymerase-3 subunit gamma/tau